MLIAICWFGLMAPVYGQENPNSGARGGIPAISNSEAQAYDIVSIRPTKTGNSGGMATLPDGFEWRNATLSQLVRGAFGIVMDSQISGLPSWTGSDSYDIVAKVDGATAERWKKLTPKERWAQEQPMMQAILADRCQFRAHQETKVLPDYDLVIAKGGLKIKEALPNESPREEMTDAGKMTVQAMPIDVIEYAFAGSIGRLIVDKTRLGAWKFDFELTWTPDDQPVTDDSSDAAPSLFTALREQLGLRLVPSKAPVQILVVDHMERPSPN